MREDGCPHLETRDVVPRGVFIKIIGETPTRVVKCLEVRRVELEEKLEQHHQVRGDVSSTPRSL